MQSAAIERFLRWLLKHLSHRIWCTSEKTFATPCVSVPVLRMPIQRTFVIACRGWMGRSWGIVLKPGVIVHDSVLALKSFEADPDYVCSTIVYELDLDPRYFESGME
jgi:hypothetical protein